MSNFLSWSRWFEYVVNDYGDSSPGWDGISKRKKDVLAVMGWVMAHASSDGTGFGIDPSVVRSMEGEIGLTTEEAGAAISALLQAGLLEDVSLHSLDILSMRAVLDIDEKSPGSAS